MRPVAREMRLHPLGVQAPCVLHQGEAHKKKKKGEGEGGGGEAQ